MPFLAASPSSGGLCREKGRFIGDSVLLPPAFWSAFGPPARRVSLKGIRAENGEASPLREKASAAYGVGRDSVADALAERCPARHSP